MPSVVITITTAATCVSSTLPFRVASVLFFITAITWISLITKNSQQLNSYHCTNIKIHVQLSQPIVHSSTKLKVVTFHLSYMTVL